jgi:multiple antibiotic resistance protein
VSPFAFGVLCFSSLFTVIDPIAAAPVFAASTRADVAAARRRTLLRAVTAALVALVLFALAGSSLLRLFGVTIDAFRIAGGVLFVGVAMPMLRGDSHGGPSPAGEGAAPGGSERSDPSVVPLGIPLIAGPGAMTTVMVLMGQTTSPAHVASFFVALVLALVATALVLALAPKALDRVGPAGLELVTRIMGLIVLVVGIQFVIDGIKPIALGVLRAAHAG